MKYYLLVTCLYYYKPLLLVACNLCTSCTFFLLVVTTSCFEKKIELTWAPIYKMRWIMPFEVWKISYDVEERVHIQSNWDVAQIA